MRVDHSLFPGQFLRCENSTLRWVTASSPLPGLDYSPFTPFTAHFSPIDSPTVFVNGIMRSGGPPCSPLSKTDSSQGSFIILPKCFATLLYWSSQFFKILSQISVGSERCSTGGMNYLALRSPVFCLYTWIKMRLKSDYLWWSSSPFSASWLAPTWCMDVRVRLKIITCFFQSFGGSLSAISQPVGEPPMSEKHWTNTLLLPLPVSLLMAF